MILKLTQFPDEATDLSAGDQLLVNLDHVAAIHASINGSIITLNNGRSFPVKESAQSIYDILPYPLTRRGLSDPDHRSTYKPEVRRMHEQEWTVHEMPSGGGHFLRMGRFGTSGAISKAAAYAIRDAHNFQITAALAARPQPRPSAINGLQQQLAAEREKLAEHIKAANEVI